MFNHTWFYIQFNLNQSFDRFDSKIRSALSICTHLIGGRSYYWNEQPQQQPFQPKQFHFDFVILYLMFVLQRNRFLYLAFSLSKAVSGAFKSFLTDWTGFHRWLNFLFVWPAAGSVHNSVCPFLWTFICRWFTADPDLIVCPNPRSSKRWRSKRRRLLSTWLALCAFDQHLQSVLPFVLLTFFFILIVFYLLFPSFLRSMLSFSNLSKRFNISQTVPATDRSFWFFHPEHRDPLCVDHSTTDPNTLLSAKLVCIQMVTLSSFFFLLIFFTKHYLNII